MPRFKTVLSPNPDYDPAINNSRYIEEAVPLTAKELAQKDAQDAQAVVRRREGTREKLYNQANEEYVKRGVSLLKINPRGDAALALQTAVMKEVYRNGPNAGNLADLHDKLDALKNTIEASDDPASIDITDDVHWS